MNVIATRNLLEECLRAGVERVVYTSSVAAIGPAPAGGRADENQLFTAGKLGIPYVNSKHEAEVEALRLAAQGLPLVCVNPCVVFGEGDIYGSSTSIVRRFMLGRIPAYVDGAINIVDVQDVARGHLLADERGSVGERYILGNRNYTLDRLFADLGRVSGVEPPALKLPPAIALRLAQALEAAPGPPADHGRRGQVGRRVVDVQDDEGEARARLDDVAARGHDRGDRELVHRPRGRPLQAVEALAADSVQAGGRDAGDREEAGIALTVLYRCPTPTNYLCACGKAARALKAKGIDFDQVRVPYRKSQRPEIEDLTKQRRVPVLVHGEEVIHDSNRIVEYLDRL